MNASSTIFVSVTYTYLCYLLLQVVAIYIMRAALSEPLGSLAQVLTSVLSAAQIQILNRIYPRLADALTEFENHRTDPDFSDSMTTKLFVFLFVNCYGTFFYIAFVASYVGDGDCGGATCMPALAVNVAIIFGIRECSGIIHQAILPYLSWRKKLKEVNSAIDSHDVKKGFRHKLTQAELQFLCPYYDVMKGSIEEYAEVVMQYGYIMLFAAALPIAPLAGLLASFIEVRSAHIFNSAICHIMAWHMCAVFFVNNNICIYTYVVQAKADLFKFLYIYQRPNLRRKERIGAWQHILEIMSSLAVMTNAGIIVFTMNTFDEKSHSFRLWYFILFQWILLGFQMGLRAVIPDVPPEVTIQMARQKILVERAIYKIPGKECVAVVFCNFVLLFIKYIFICF